MDFATIKPDFGKKVNKTVVKCDERPEKLKRKRQDISLETKLKIIEAVDRGGRKKKDIAKEFRIPSTTLSSLLKYRDKILETKNSGTSLSMRKRVRGAKHSELDKELTVWYCQRRNHNLSVNGPLLREKAEEIANKLGIVGFKCSNGWLQRMKARNLGIYGTKRTYKRTDQPEFEYIDAEEQDAEIGDEYHEDKSFDEEVVYEEEEEQEIENVTKILISYEDYNQERKYKPTSNEEFLLEGDLRVESSQENEYISNRPQRVLPAKADAFNALDIIKQVIDSPDVEASDEVFRSFNLVHKFIQESYPQFVQLKINNFFTKLK